MSGKIYAIGVGPGDPELLTLKAVKIIKNVDVIACPERSGKPGMAYRIAEQAVPKISSKELLLLEFPMRKDELSRAHEKAACHVISYLSEGKDVAFLTLGDPEFYSTFYYVADIIKDQGYEIEIISGITSFSAASARLKLPISLGDESVMITSGTYCEFDGTLVILKVGKRLKEIKEQVSAAQKNAYLVENYGMPDERVYPELNSIPDEAGYLSVMIVKSS